MIIYKNHNFIELECDDKNPWFWMYCAKCTIGAWFDVNYEPNVIRSLHSSRKMFNESIVFGPKIDTKHELSCEEYQIKKLLE